MTESDKDYAIEIKNLRKEYGELIAVNDISFKIRRGEVFSFLGPNGAGKTTTVEMIEMIRKPTNGVIKVLGRDIHKHHREIKQRIGVLPQEFDSFDRLTVRETLQYFRGLYEKKKDIDKIMDMIDLRDYEKMLYKNLSGGLKQRVGVAITLVNDPDIIFLDEPTTGLDPKARRDVWKVIEGLKSEGKTIFLTTHYMEEAENLSDRIAVIHKGKIIARGTTDELIKKYGEGIKLTIKGGEKKSIIQTITHLGFETNTNKNSDVIVKIVNNSQIMDILNKLKEENIAYREIDVRRSNLEEVFLNLTGEKLLEEED